LGTLQLDVDKNWYKSFEDVRQAEERNINRFFMFLNPIIL